MWANIMSAWLCAAVGAADELWAVDGAAERSPPWFPELLHAPMVATAASAASPMTAFFALLTTHPFRWVGHLVCRPGFRASIGCPSRSVKIR